MIEKFQDIFRLDQMVAWYFSDPIGTLFFIVIIGLVFASSFQKRRSRSPRAVSPSEEPKDDIVDQSPLVARVLHLVQVVAILWIYWINAEFADLHAGQRGVLYGAAFLLVYTAVLTQRKHNR